MNSTIVGTSFLILLLVLLLFRVHVAIALLLVGVLGFLILVGPGGAFGLMAVTPFKVTASYEWSVLPLFILMGLLSFEAGFTEPLYKAAYQWFGKIPGGLVIATMMGGAAFATVCGSSVAAAAVFSKVAYPEMCRYNYDKKLATGAISAVGTLAIMIPPSAAMVFYGIFTEQSIGKLLIAGILPGILSALMFSLMVFIRCTINPDLAGRVQETISWKQRFISLKDIWATPLIAVVILGGIYSGVFTPTEAAGVGAFIVLLIGVSIKKLKGRNILSALLETSTTAAMIFFVILGAMILGRFLAVTQLPVKFGQFLLGIQIPGLAVVCGFLLMFLVLGTFMDGIAIMAVTLPIIFPIVKQLGFDSIWFGVLTVKTIEIGLMTPPVGLTVFTVKGTLGDAVSLEDVFKGAVPFVVTDIVTLAILVALPGISLLLPALMNPGR